MIKDKLLIQQFFDRLKTKIDNIDNDSLGVCYPGGNAAICIIRLPNDIGVKIYNNNKIRNEQIFKFQKYTKNLIYKNNNYIQKVHDCFEVGNMFCTIQEWVNGPTLKEIFYENSFNYLNVKTILDDLYLNFIIPLWNQGLIWQTGSLNNFCLTNNLVSIDNDNMYKTATEIINNNSFNIRDNIRKKSYITHNEMVHLMCSSVTPNYNKLAFKELDFIYFNPIDSDWIFKSNGCYLNFLKVLWE